MSACSAYIDKANKTADIAVLEAIETAAMAANAKEGAVTSIKLTLDSDGVVTKVEVNINNAEENDVLTYTNITDDDDFKAYVGTFPTLKTFKSSATWYAADPDGTGNLIAGWN